MRQQIARLGIIIILAIASVFLARVTAFSALVMQHGTQADGSYTAYLPIISKPPCTDFSASLYSAASTAVLTIGETITVTGVLVNDGCARLGAPYFATHPNPTTVLTTAYNSIGYFVVIPPGGYQEASFVFRAIASGPVTVTMGVSYEILAEGLPPGAVGGRAAIPLLIRVLPISPTMGSLYEEE